LHDLAEVRRVEEKRREENREGKDEKEEKGRKKKIDCECAHHPITITTIPPPPLDPCAMELSGSGLCPSWRGWGICPARARPSWFMRGRARGTTSRRSGKKEEMGGPKRVIKSVIDRSRVKEKNALKFYKIDEV
jgi:hypothetical protein